MKSATHPTRCSICWRLFVYLLLLSGTQSFAESDLNLSKEIVRFAKLNQRGDLPSSRINAIVQDKDDYIWIGTSNGLSRFDGARFETIRPNEYAQERYQSNFIEALFASSDGTLWVSSQDSLFYIPQGQKNLHEIPILGPNSKNLVRSGRALFETSRGKLVASYRSGLAIIDANNRSLENFISREETEFPFVTGMLEERPGHLLLSSRSGLWELDVQAAKVSPNEDYQLNGESLSNLGIRTIYKDTKSNLWLGTFNGLLGFDAEGARINCQIDSRDFFAPERPLIRDIMEDSNGVLWVGSTTHGLYSKQPDSKKTFTHHRYEGDELEGPPSTSIREIIETASGHILVGTFENGVWHRDPQQLPVRYLRHHESESSNLPFNAISSVAYDETRNAIWMSDPTEGLALYELNADRAKLVLDPEEPGNPLHQRWLVSFDVAPDGDLVLIFSNFDLIKWNPDTNESRILVAAKNARASVGFAGRLQVDSLGRIWVLAPARYVYDLRTDERISLTPLQDDNKSAVALAVDDQENAWVISHRQGFGYYDYEKRSITKWYPFETLPEYLDSRQGVSFLKDDGILWIGTKNGLCSFDIKTEAFTSYPKINYALTNIVKDQSGAIWASTHGDILRFDPQRNDLSFFDEADGFHAANFNSYSMLSLPDDQIAIAGQHGLNLFQTKPPHNPTQTTKARITRVELNGIEVERRGKDELSPLELKHDQNHLAFEFAAAYPLETAGKDFEYRLLGQSSDWIAAPENMRIPFYGLPPGNYDIEVRARSKTAGITNDSDVFSFSIRPPILSTNAFRIPAALAIFGLSVFIIWRRSNSLRTRNELLEREVKLRTADLEQSRLEALEAKQKAENASKAKSEFLASMSHEIRTPMNGIVGMNQLILQSSVSDEIRHYSETIDHSAETMLVLINDLLDISKIEANKIEIERAPLNFRDLCEDLAELLAIRAHEKDLDFHFE
ncbi:MAG: two-component regulator propeller domain-containing protein, partial [Verrucomicrobiota bacterium]